MLKTVRVISHQNSMKFRDRIGITDSRQRQLTRVMEVSLIGLFFIGVDRGHTGIIVNTVVALLVTQLPSILERNFNIHLDARLTLWITSAVFLHAIGVTGLPGTNINLYQSVWWWDHLTHALSSSVVAGVGYSVVRAIDIHSDQISLPSEFIFVFILLFVIAFGVLWEVIEFSLGFIAERIGGQPVLIQFGLRDTMLDLVFDVIGAVIVAIWGTAHLGGVVDIITDRMARNG